MSLPSYVHLQNAEMSVILHCPGGVPVISYMGKALSDVTSTLMLQQLTTRQEAKCSPAVEPPLSLVPHHGEGFTGHPGLQLSGQDDQWAAGFSLVAVDADKQQAVFDCRDDLRSLQLHVHVRLDTQLNLMQFSTSLTNLGKTEVQVHYLNAATLPLSPNYQRAKTFEGRWSNEFQTRDILLQMGAYVRENRRGKTSHDCFPGIILCHQGTSEQHGECLGLHLGASANHRLMVEVLNDGRRYVQMGELLFPGECRLHAGEKYRSPTLFVSYSENGLSSMSQQFHRFIRRDILQHRPDKAPRQVHYNTWEGIYFNHDVSTLTQLATHASQLGVERFVLDDGWFNGRRSDRTGLGDWYVDSSVYPDGLTPLIQQVNQLGMTFGIWFEPEMVNPDSDLYRQHPEWALQTRHNPQVPFRHQYVLDLSNPEVCEYLFNRIDDILTTYPDISYIKWDMNRDVNHPGNSSGQPSMHKQTQALYGLLAKVKQHHPHLEIESCCSGGGRVDLEILRYTDRFWTSDSNDALDRLVIQRGFSYFFPAEVMGAHVGPRDCHITGRHLSIELRAAVAMFGHMGIEMDPRELTEHERKVLSDAISIYKKNRSWLHSADLFRLDDDGLNINFGYVSDDKQRAIFAYNSIKETGHTTPGRYYFVGLDRGTAYRLTRLWPETLKEYSPSVLQATEGEVFSGEALMQIGLQLPVLFPQTALVFLLEAVS